MNKSDPCNLFTPHNEYSAGCGPETPCCGRPRINSGTAKNVSNETPLSEHHNGRSLMSRGVTIYFVVLFVLTCIAFIPDAITIGTLLFILPGLVLIAAGTVLFYSIALLPAYLIYRHLGKRLLAGGVAAFSIAGAALLPHYVEGYWLRHLVASDASDPPTSFRPRSLELPYQEGDISWTNWRGQPMLRPPPPCADLCQQLLFKGNVDQVFVSGDSSQDPLANGTIVITGGKAYHLSGGGKRTFRPDDLGNDVSVSVEEIPAKRVLDPAKFFKPKWRRFRLQQQETCPSTLSIVKFAEEGRCLIEDVVDSADADVVLSIAEAPPVRQDDRSSNPCLRLSYRGIQNGPTTVTLAERRSGKLIPVETKTALTAQYATIPFYFGVRPVEGEFPRLCLGIATDPFPRSYADPYEMIGRRYGLPIARAADSKRPPRSR